MGGRPTLGTSGRGISALDPPKSAEKREERR
jgi:hypothetical protein